MIRLSFVLCLLLAGCSARDPATEAPVDLKPGMYDLTTAGQGRVALNGGGDRGQKCLGDTEAKEFGSHPLRAATKLWRGCSDTDEPRRGNAINGKRFCKGASFRDDDESIYNYTAEIDQSGEGFVIKGETKDKEDGSGPDTGPWRIVARRVGDC